MVYIICKNYEHFNKALPNWNSPKGRYIRNKHQYQEEMKKAGLIPYEQAERILEQKEREYRDWKPKPTKDCLDIIEAARQSADKKGRVKLSDRTIDKMIKMGAIKNRDIFADKLPKHYQEKGGFK